MDFNFYENTDHNVIINIGKPRSGKTFLTKWFILKHTIDPKSKFFHWGIVITKTAFDREDYEYIPEEYVVSGWNQERIEHYIEQLKDIKRENGKVPPSFMILDDIVADNDILQNPFFKNLCAITAHLSLTIILSGQYLFQSANPVLRECATIVFMFRTTSGRTLKGLWENFGQLFDKFDDFKKHLLKITRPKHTALMYIANNDMEDNYVSFKAPAEVKDIDVELQFDSGDYEK